MPGAIKGCVLARPEICSLQPYQPDCISCGIKLDANESSWDIPPEVKETFFARVKEIAINRYPDATWKGLRTALSERHGVAAEQILIGNGSSELILALMQTFGGAGRRVVYPAPSFAMYPIYAVIAGAVGVEVTLDEHFKLDSADVITQSRQQGTGLVMLCSPNNPTGNAMALEDIEQIIAKSPCVVAVDEAYFEFHGITALPLIHKYSNVVILRTFSKAYGLAGARVGYLLGSKPVVEQIAKVVLPYNVNMLSLTMAEVLMSQAAVFLPRVQVIVEERERMAELLAAIPGVFVFPSRSNFLCFKTRLSSEIVTQQLLKADIGIKDLGKDIPKGLRVTVGIPSENDSFIQALRSIMTGVV